MPTASHLPYNTGWIPFTLPDIIGHLSGLLCNVSKHRCVPLQIFTPAEILCPSKSLPRRHAARGRGRGRRSGWEGAAERAARTRSMPVGRRMRLAGRRCLPRVPRRGLLPVASRPARRARDCVRERARRRILAPHAPPSLRADCCRTAVRLPLPQDGAGPHRPAEYSGPAADDALPAVVRAAAGAGAGAVHAAADATGANLAPPAPLRRQQHACWSSYRAGGQSGACAWGRALCAKGASRRRCRPLGAAAVSTLRVCARRIAMTVAARA